MSNTTIAYRFDSKGYYLDTRLVQLDENQEAMLPFDCTLTEPKAKTGYWSKWNGKKWTNEKIPTTCEEAIEAGLSCISNGQGKHNYEVKALLEALVANDSENYRIAVSDSFIMTIEAIPEPTPEEIALEEEKAEKQENAAYIAELKDAMITAMALDDEEWLAELKEEYSALVYGE